MRELLIIFGLLISSSALAQHNIQLGYYNTHLGQNYSVIYQLDINRFQIELGIKYLNFNPKYECSSYLLRDRARPKTFLKHFGPVLGFNSKFPIRSTNLRFEVFLQTQYIYAGLHHRTFAPYGFTPDGRELYTYTFVIFDEQHNLENVVGVGFDLNITPRLRFYNRFGPELLVFWGIDERILIGGGNVYSEFGLTYSAGITYSFARIE